MKAWIKSLSYRQYSNLHNLCNWGFALLGLLLLWSKAWLGHNNDVVCWGGWVTCLVLQFVSTTLVVRWRYACSECNQQCCLEHR